MTISFEMAENGKVKPSFWSWGSFLSIRSCLCLDVDFIDFLEDLKLVSRDYLSFWLRLVIATFPIKFEN